MLKVRSRTKDGKVLFVFGLSAKNRQMLLRGFPIYFAGAEVGQPDAHFLICHASDQQRLERERQRFADNDPRYLYTVGLDRGVIERLPQQHGYLDGLRDNTSAILLIAGETEEEMGAALGIHTQPVRSGFRDEFDPLSGTVRRVPVEKPS